MERDVVVDEHDPPRPADAIHDQDVDRRDKFARDVLGEKVGRAIAQDVCSAGDSDRADDERRRHAVNEAALEGEGEHLVIGRLGDDAGVGMVRSSSPSPPRCAGRL